MSAAPARGKLASVVAKGAGIKLPRPHAAGGADRSSAIP